MINIDNYVNENKSEHNEKCPYIPDHLYRIIIIGGSGSAKTNALINFKIILILTKFMCMQEI